MTVRLITVAILLLANLAGCATTSPVATSRTVNSPVAKKTATEETWNETVPPEPADARRKRMFQRQVDQMRLGAVIASKCFVTVAAFPLLACDFAKGLINGETDHDFFLPIWGTWE